MSKTFTTLFSLLALFNRETRPDLFGPRKRGSVSNQGLENLTDRPVTEFRPAAGDVPVARYFRVEAPEIGGAVGAKAFRDLSEKQKTMLRTRFIENHGLEFYLDVPESIAGLKPVDHVTVILGPSADAEHGEDSGYVPWTWFPGDVLGDMNHSDTALGDVAVKLHNG